MISFWEKQSLLRYDYVVLGGGIVGLTTAAALCERQPGSRVALLERGLLPTGASTKNAGFACFGSVGELSDDLTHSTVEEMAALVRFRYEGLQALRRRLGDQAIGWEAHGGWELLYGSEEPLLDMIPVLNEWLHPVFGQAVFEDQTALLAKMGFGGQVRHLIANRFEGQIDTGRMMDALWTYASRLGVRILTGAHVTDWEENPDHLLLHVRQGAGSWTLEAGQVAICTNAFAGELLPELDIRPGRGQVLITEPVPDLPFKGVFHLDKGYYYFRHVGDRVLLGGGRNLDFEGETTTELSTTSRIQDDLRDKLENLILPGRPVQIADTWAGIMAFGPTKKPIVSRHSPRICIGVRMGGMGVAIGSLIGEQVAEQLRRTS